MKLQERWKRLRSMQADELVEWLRFQSSDVRSQKRAFFLWIAFVAFIAADTAASLVDSQVPEAPVSVEPSRQMLEKIAQGQRLRYAEIIEHDIFSSTGAIPEDGYVGGPAVRTHLPFALVGSVIFEDPDKSMATIDDRSLDRIFAIQSGDYILDKARIEKVEDFKVVFTNLKSGMLEYVDMPHDEAPRSTEFPVNALSGVKKVNPSGINALDDTHYEVQRETIDRSISNIGQLLQEANAIPNFENGNLNGYKVVQVKAGSMFEQLGIKIGDIISNVNGTPVSDPAKALQLLSDLKNTSQVTLAIRRDGTPVTLNYSLR